MFGLGIIVTLIIFTLIVLVHEGGHFALARFFGVKVEEFGLGIPPRAKKLFSDSRGTLYSLNWLPLGGFVRLKGESEAMIALYGKNKKRLQDTTIKKHLLDDSPLYYSDGTEISLIDREKIQEIFRQNQEKDNLCKKPYWQQGLVILAGVTMNFFLAWGIFSFLFFFGVQPIGINTVLDTKVESLLIPNLEQALERGIIIKGEGVVLYPLENSNASHAGLQEADIVQRLGGVKISSLDQFRDILLKNKGKEISLEILRKEASLFADVLVGEDGKIGSYISDNLSYNKDFTYKLSPVEAIKSGGNEVFSQSVLTLQGLKYIFSKIFFPVKEGEREEAIKSMSGPIGLTEIVTEGLSLGGTFIFVIAALISVNLGVFNLLPIPALDGGRFLFICLHAFFGLFSKGKFISTYSENIVHVFFFILFIAMSIIIAYNDIVKLIH